MEISKIEADEELTQRKIMERVFASPDRSSENDAILADLRAKAKRTGYCNFEEIICGSLGFMALELISAAKHTHKDQGSLGGD